MIFMISLLTCCKTHQSVIEKSTVIATDTTTIRRVAVKDSTSLNAKIDSIIIEEYAADDRIEQTNEGHNNPDYKVSPCQKRNDISQNEFKQPTRKIKMYSVNLSSTLSAQKDSIHQQTRHQEKTISQVKQKTTSKRHAGGKIVYVLIGITLLLFAGYVVWKNAVQ